MSDDVVKLNFKRNEAGRKLKNIAPTSIERRGDKLHIAGEEIKINHALYRITYMIKKLTTYALYMESARITMERTMAQLLGLEETEKDVGSQKKELQYDLGKLKEELNALESKIKKKLKPRGFEQMMLMMICRKV